MESPVVEMVRAADAAAPLRNDLLFMKRSSPIAARTLQALSQFNQCMGVSATVLVTLA